MKREDIKPEELEGLLVAFADGELDEPRSSEMADLISEHADLAAKVEDHMSTGDQLKDFFDTKNVETPAHIAEQILQMADKAETSSIAAAAAMSSSSSNIISFATFKKLNSKLSITTQSLTQMAAALTIGVFLGPSLFEEFGSQGPYKPKTAEEQSIQTRGASDVSFEDGSRISLLMTVVQKQNKQSDDTEPYIYSGGTIAADTPFTILVTAPLGGRLEVFDITEGKTQSAIWGAEVQEGAEVTIPDKQAFELSDQDTFVVRLLFSNDVSKVQIEASFIVAPP
jgi:hypothetical protein